MVSDASGQPPLACKEQNPSGTTTILFIHGAFSSGAEWDLVAPLLAKTYHVLLPDLPSHGHSPRIPFSVLTSTRLLASLVHEKAKGRKAHIVGLSLGAHVAIHLACTYPEVVEAVFVSGYEVFPRSWMTPYLPYAVWLNARLEHCMPRALTRWLMDGADIPRGDVSIVTLPLCRAVIGPMFEEVKWPEPWKARTLVVAAGKRGILPTADHPEDARRLAAIGREGNEATTAVVCTRGRHPWNRQLPLIFAEAVKNWIEDDEVGTEFVRL